jgi:hypothetical protein
MQVLNLLFKNFMGQDHELSALSHWMKELWRDSNILTKGKVKNFRACHRLFNHVLDGHILGAIGAHFNVDNCVDLCLVLERRNWRKAIKRIRAQYSGLKTVANWREEIERDVAHENAVLLLQLGLMYRDFSTAMRYGDSGRVEHCLLYFATMFQATRQTNYAHETLHLVACLKGGLWSDELRQFWLDNCLLNPSGSRKGFMPDDMVGELVVRYFKELVPDNLNPARSTFLREVLARNVMILRDVRNNVLRISGATNYYQHSSTVTRLFAVRMIAEELLRQEIFVHHSPQRPDEMDIKPAKDLYDDGALKLWTAVPIRKYQEKMEAGGTSFPIDDDSEDESEEDENEDEDMDGYADDHENDMDDDDLMYDSII